MPWNQTNAPLLLLLLLLKRALQRDQEHNLKHPSSVDLIGTKQNKTKQTQSEHNVTHNTLCYKMWDFSASKSTHTQASLNHDSTQSHAIVMKSLVPRIIRFASKSEIIMGSWELWTCWAQGLIEGIIIIIIIIIISIISPSLG
jgi:flagellar hook protein FlgE